MLKTYWQGFYTKDQLLRIMIQSGVAVELAYQSIPKRGKASLLSKGNQATRITQYGTNGAKKMLYRYELQREEQK